MTSLRPYALTTLFRVTSAIAARSARAPFGAARRIPLSRSVAV